MKILAALCIVSLATGCATTLTDEEAAKCEGNESCLVEALEDKVKQKQFESEHKQAVDSDNYNMCVKAYRNMNIPMIHRHHHDRLTRIRWWMIKDDLFYNSCRSAIGPEVWAKY